jgi:hypothetical protein
MLTQSEFGTSGWRALMAEEFTFANVRRAVGGIARYVASQKPQGARMIVESRAIPRRAPAPEQSPLAAKKAQDSRFGITCQRRMASLPAFMLRSGRAQGQVAG